MSGTDAETNEFLELSVNLGQRLVDRLLWVLGQGLFEENNTLEVPVEATFHDLRERRFRLALIT